MRHIGSIVLFGLFAALSTACAQRAALSEEDKALVAQLQGQAAEVDQQIQEAKVQDEKLAGGLIKSLIAVRLELLGINHALLLQRIQSIEAGAPVSITVPGTRIDPELAKQLESELVTQERVLVEAKNEAAKYSGGLVAALKSSTVATQENSMAMLRQRWLIAKFGLSFPQLQAVAEPKNEPRSIAAEPPSSQTDQIVAIRLLQKRFAKQNYQDYIFFDVQYEAVGLVKAARAIKGRLQLKDLFGEVKMTIGWTIDSGLVPGQVAVERGTGFDYNQFMDEHQWVNSTPLENMTSSFEVISILYTDGTRQDF